MKFVVLRFLARIIRFHKKNILGHNVTFINKEKNIAWSNKFLFMKS